MRSTQIFLRSGLAVAAAALPLTLAAPAAFAGGGSPSWRNVSTGTHTVAVVCQDGSSAGSQTVTVGSSPTASSTTAPMRGVRGGLGGGTEDHSTPTLAAGGALVTAAVGGGALYPRRRPARNRL
jgi:hypothetical protein